MSHTLTHYECIFLTVHRYLTVFFKGYLLTSWVDNSLTPEFAVKCLVPMHKTLGQVSHNPIPDAKKQQTQCDLLKVSQRACWESDQDCWHQVSYGTTRLDHILLPLPFLSIIPLLPSWVLFTKTVFHWEIKGSSSEVYHLSWKGGDDSEITRCLPQGAGPEKWPPAQAECVASGTICSEEEEPVVGEGGSVQALFCVHFQGEWKR